MKRCKRQTPNATTKFFENMQRPPGYFENVGPDGEQKWTKVTEDGLRINLYKSGVVTCQTPGTEHSAYAKRLGENFSSMSQSAMSDYAFGLFRVKS